MALNLCLYLCDFYISLGISNSSIGDFIENLLRAGTEVIVEKKTVTLWTMREQYWAAVSVCLFLMF